MPRLASDFDPAEPGSVHDYPIDFGPYIPLSGSITTVVWATTVRHVASGFTLDPTPSALVHGAASIIGSATIQRLSGFVAGNTYLVTATATMSDGEVCILWCTLPCVPPA
jgi:NADPH:quinone reductase-like Zn-dependent oxidoreductase